MTSQGQEKPRIGEIFKGVLITTCMVVFPGIQWAFMGWLHLLLPAVVFYVLSKHGSYAGKKVVGIATAISLPILIFLGQLELVPFSLVMMASGYILYQSQRRADSVALSGLKGSVALGIGWFVILAISSIGQDLSAYGQLLAILDEGIIEALEHYRQSDTITAETLVMLEATLTRMQTVVPIILPSILGSLVLVVTWLTMVLGNKIVLTEEGQSSWREYKYWELPDRLIWVVIATAILSVIPVAPVQAIGINLLLLIGLLYFFQGLSIGVFFLQKWNVPLFLRIFFYVMIIFQSIGAFFLLFLGIADIWLDFRRLHSKD